MKNRNKKSLRLDNADRFPVLNIHWLTSPLTDGLEQSAFKLRFHWVGDGKFGDGEGNRNELVKRFRSNVVEGSGGLRPPVAVNPKASSRYRNKGDKNRH